MTHTDAQSLGAHIKTARKAAGFSSVRALADEMGMSHSYLAKLERGEAVNPSMEILQRIADTFSIGLDELLGDKNNGSEGDLPEPRVYFRRKFGMSPEDADMMARLIEKYQRGQKGGHHDEDD